jgi:CheY-like chemotaxis protein
MLNANALACQSTPIVGSTGRLLGIISTHFRVLHRPTRGQLALMDKLARDAADLIEQSQMSQSPAMDVQRVIEESHDSTASLLSTRARSVCILVAAADDETRGLLRDSLSRAGCDVIDAADGREALVKALSQKPVVVITETRLPIFDGYALCDVLRRDSTTRTVPILVVTSENRPDEIDRARAAGVDAVLPKPVTPDALLSEVQRLLERPEPSARNPQNERAHGSQANPYLRSKTTTRTTTPPVPPPHLTCPLCDRLLKYTHSHVGGVSRRLAEQWDVFACPGSCGTFEYRPRTGKVRRVN